MPTFKLRCSIFNTTLARRKKEEGRKENDNDDDDDEDVAQEHRTTEGSTKPKRRILNWKFWRDSLGIKNLLDQR